MKKRVFIPIMSALALLASCSQNEIVGKAQSSNAISFGTSVGAVGRGDVITNENIANFKVYAVNTESDPWTTATGKTNNFMPGDVVTKSEDLWTYNPIKYWPENGNVTFYAYAPQNAAVSNLKFSGEGNPQFTYEVDYNPANQVDLLADIRTDLTKATEKVSFDFKHLLSKIGFEAHLSADLADEAIMSITGFTINYNGLVKGGTYTYGAADQAAGSWAAGEKYGETATSDNFVESPLVLSSASESTLASNLMLMPQAAPTFGVTITYKVKYSDDMEVTGQTKPITLPIYEAGWEAGKQYVYNFALSLTKVEFTGINVVEWEDEVEIPWTEAAVIITDGETPVATLSANFNNTASGSKTFKVEGAESVELENAFAHFDCTYDASPVEVSARAAETKDLVFTSKVANTAGLISESGTLIVTDVKGEEHKYSVTLTQEAGEASCSLNAVNFLSNGSADGENIATVLGTNGITGVTFSAEESAFKASIVGMNVTFTAKGENKSTTDPITETATIKTTEGVTYDIILTQAKAKEEPYFYLKGDKDKVKVTNITLGYESKTYILSEGSIVSGQSGYFDGNQHGYWTVTRDGELFLMGSKKGTGSGNITVKITKTDETSGEITLGINQPS